MDNAYPETLKTSRLILSQEQIDDYMTNGLPAVREDT
jgi:hypothetical protein